MRRPLMRTILMCFILLLLVLPLLHAAGVYPIYVRPKSGSSLQPNMMFEYEFNFTANADCTGILLSNRTNITTDAGGLGFVELNISTLVQLPRYLCEWRNGTLRKIHPIADSISDREFILNVHSNNGTFNGTLNVTANNPFFCTRCINTSALSISAVIDEHVQNVSVNKLLNLSDLNNTHVHSALNITHDVINESRLPNATASTRGGILALNCSGTDKVAGMLGNGSPVCAADQTSGAGVDLNGGWINNSGNTSTVLSVNITGPVLNVTSTIIDINLSKGNVKFPTTACSGTNKVTEINSTGGVVCATDAGGGGDGTSNLTLAQTGGWGYSNVTTGFGTGNVSPVNCPLGQHVNGTQDNGSLTCRANLNSTGFGTSNLTLAQTGGWGYSNVTSGFGTGNVSPVNCPLGQHVNGTQENGSLTCRVNLNSTGFGSSNLTLAQTGGWGYSNVTSGFGTSNLTTSDIPLNPSVNIQNVTNLTYTSVQCTSTDKLRNITINPSGISGICDTDATGGSGFGNENVTQESCALGQHVNGSLPNGSLTCRANLNSTGFGVSNLTGAQVGTSNLTLAETGGWGYSNVTTGFGTSNYSSVLYTRGLNLTNVSISGTVVVNYSEVQHKLNACNGSYTFQNATEDGISTCVFVPPQNNLTLAQTGGWGYSNVTSGFGTGNVSPVNCPLGQHVNGTQDNGSLTCRVNLNSTGFGTSNLTLAQTGGWGYSNVTADLNGGWINNSGNTSTVLGVNITGPVLNITSGIIDVNLSKGTVKFPTTTCSGTDKVTSINSTGGVICAADQGGGGDGTSNLTLAETGGWGYSNVTSGFGTSNLTGAQVGNENVTQESCGLGQHVNGSLPNGSLTCRPHLNATGFGTSNLTLAETGGWGYSNVTSGFGTSNLTLTQTGGWGYSNVTTGFGTSNITGAQVGNKNVTQETCPLGQHINGSLPNGSLTCRVHLNSTGFGTSNLTLAETGGWGYSNVTSGFGTSNLTLAQTGGYGSSNFTQVPQNCSVGQHQFGEIGNGSINCRVNLNSTGFGSSNLTLAQTGGWGYSNVTTGFGTSNVTADLNGGWINNSGNTSTILGVNITGPVLNVTSGIIDVNLSKGTVKFPTTSCSGNDKVTSVNSTGGVVCGTDAGGGGDGIGNVSPVNCGLGQHVNGTQDNGSLTCRANLNSTGFGSSNLTLAQTGGWGYSNVTTGFGTSNVTADLNGGWINNSGNTSTILDVNITGQRLNITSIIIDVNLSKGTVKFPTTRCSGTDKVTEINSTGGVVCAADQTTGGGVDLDGGWKNNSGNTSTVLSVNITGPVLNVTSSIIDINLSRGTVDFPTTSCTGTDKVTGINVTGGVSCAADQTGGGGGGVQVNYTTIPLIAGRFVGTNLGVARVNWSSFVYDFADAGLPRYARFRIRCSASVASAQTGDIAFNVFLNGNAFFTGTNLCSINSNTVGIQTATTGWINLTTGAFNSTKGNMTFLLQLNDSVSTDDPFIYSAYIDMRAP